MDKILATERDQVLTMLIEGCVAWHRKGGTARPAAVEAETARYRSQQNTVANFVTECCLTVPAGASDWVEMTDSLAWYRVWVAQRKSGPPLGVTTFYEHMEALGGVAREDNGGQCAPLPWHRLEPRGPGPAGAGSQLWRATEPVDWEPAAPGVIWLDDPGRQDDPWLDGRAGKSTEPISMLLL